MRRTTERGLRLAQILCIILPALARASTEEACLFSSYRGNGNDGLHLAYSQDGLTWTPLKNDTSFLKPKVGGKLLRDPCILFGPDKVFHMVWTTGPTNNGIGLAHSSNLINWTEQEFVPVMAHEPAARNCWAPEIIWDPDKQHYVLFWASTVTNRFEETAAAGEAGWNHRLYLTTTKDFITYSPTSLLLDPGFTVIDASMTRTTNGWVMVIKDETRTPPAKNLRLARAAHSSGPWTVSSAPFTPPDLWVEGPSILRMDDSWLVFYEEYANQRFGGMQTKDFDSWQNISGQLAFPKWSRHGTAFHVPRAILEALLKADQLEEIVDPKAPPNEAATVTLEKESGRLRIQYRGRTLLDAQVGIGTELAEQIFRKGDTLEQVLTLLGTKHVELHGIAQGSDTTIAAETRGTAQDRFPMVRTASGPSHNLRNNAVYDRHWDWLLSGPGTRTAITPQGPGRFDIFITGDPIQLRFRPRFIQKHLGMASSRPWTNATPLLPFFSRQTEERNSKVLVVTSNQVYDLGTHGGASSWTLLEISRSFEHWNVLTRKNDTDQQIPPATIIVAELGLPANCDYLVYEHHSRRFMGDVRASFVAPALNAHSRHDFAIREKLNRPHVISTSQHESQGGVDLESVTWRGRALKGRSHVVAGEPYDITLHVPAPFRLTTALFDGKPADIPTNGTVTVMSFLPRTSELVDWSAQFHSQPE